jgi:hypothetical protein
LLVGLSDKLLGAVLLKDWLQRRAENRRTRERVLQLYLLQLQDAIESLWYRLNNLKNRGGRAMMEDGYFEISTLYILGRVLAYERILLLDGIYLKLEKFRPGLEAFLKKSLKDLDEKFGKRGFHRYNRLALAESVMERGDDEHFRTRNYIDFREDYEAKNSVVNIFLKPARDYLNGFQINDTNLSAVMDELQSAAKRLADETGIGSTLPHR